MAFRPGQQRRRAHRAALSGHGVFLEELGGMGRARLFKPVDVPLARRGGAKPRAISQGAFGQRALGRPSKRDRCQLWVRAKLAGPASILFVILNTSHPNYLFIL